MVLAFEKKEYIFLDLDGTLTDSGLGITNSVMYALRYFGIEETDRSKLYKFIGPPLVDSFKMFYGFSEDKAKEAMNKYREYFAVTGLYENEVYAGIEELLKKLVAAGKKPVLATSKPELYAFEILRHFNLEEYFYFKAGSDFEETRAKKSEVIAYALRSLSIEDKSSVVMVGDRLHDIHGAKDNGLDSIGVLYGFGNREELENAGADCIAADVEELGRILGV